MMGKGSVNHNKRKFFADNVDQERTAENITFIDKNLKEVYHMLFDKVLEKYNEKQTRNDRKVPDYYEKIRTSKQEKLFYEVIFQIGNKDDMNARDENGEMAKKILCEFMNNFQSRNPYLKVFSAHLHMDEETPHLHVDFVPFTTGSKRGLETRVSLKKALLQQGFKGGTCSENERNQWAQAEKKELSNVMQRYGVMWKKLDTHGPHLSLLEYKKQERVKEVDKLEKEIEHINTDRGYFTLNAQEYDVDERWQVPLPKSLMSVNKYKELIVEPFVEKLKAVIKTILETHIKFRKEYRKLESDINELKRENSVLSNMFGTAMNDYKAVSKELENRTGKKKMRKTDYMKIARDMGKER